MTTEDGATRRRVTISVRTRITAAVALLTALALGGAGLVVYLLEVNRIDRTIAASVDRELTEFRSFQRQARDPTTGRAYADPPALLRGFLAQNLAEDEELLVAWYDDGPRLVQGEEDIRTVLDDADLRAGVRQRVDEGGTFRVDTSEGPVSVTVQPVRAGDRRAALLDVYVVSEARADLRSTLTTYLVVAAGSLVLITAIAAAQAGRLLQPLRRLRERAESTATGADLADRIPETGHDDITALTRTWNAMLDRLQTAFADQRTFLDDAGHELKTPLTVVRGHVELIDPHDPVDTAETRDLVLDEVDRMSRLVEDLIMLAKAGRPDFVRPAATDVGALTRTLLDKCRPLGTRQWHLEQSADVEAVIDEQRLTQAVLQLAENAVKHTEPGGVVVVGSEVDAGRLRFQVTDDGPGVPDEQKQAVFERFDRGGVHDDAGVGLGLSIVRAIAEAHGGAVRVLDAEPRGARFVLEVPLVRPAAEGESD